MLAAMVVTIAGCTADKAPCECLDTQAAPPVDSSLMAFLSLARAAHHSADALEQQDALAPAVEKLQHVIEAASEPLEKLAEVREVLADTYARLADLRGRQGNYDAAQADIAAGLSLAPPESYFEGHLHEMRGVNEERRAKALEAQGKIDEAKRARKAALDALEKAVMIQERVIDNTLNKDGG